MRYITYDILSLMAEPGQTVWKIVPTNGDVNKRGEAVMGAGLAKAVAEMYPFVPVILATQLKIRGNYPNYLGLHDTCHWFSFPTKYSWKDKQGSYQLIDISTLRLAQMIDDANPDFVLLPKVGCGNARLRWPQVHAILDAAFCDDDRVVIVTLP